MTMPGIFGGTIPVLEKALDLRSMKHNLLASNIANMDTPNYQAFDLMVEEEMKKAFGSGEKMGLEKTQPGHLSGDQPIAGGSGVTAAETGRFKLEGDESTVDIDQQMAKLSENQLMYSASAQILSKKFQALRSAIAGGGR